MGEHATPRPPTISDLARALDELVDAGEGLTDDEPRAECVARFISAQQEARVLLRRHFTVDQATKPSGYTGSSLALVVSGGEA